MHTLLFLHTEVIGLCFDGIKLCPGAKLGPRVWQGGGEARAVGEKDPRIEEGSSFKLAEN